MKRSARIKAKKKEDPKKEEIVDCEEEKTSMKLGSFKMIFPKKRTRENEELFNVVMKKKMKEFHPNMINKSMANSLEIFNIKKEKKKEFEGADFLYDTIDTKLLAILSIQKRFQMLGSEKSKEKKTIRLSGICPDVFFNIMEFMNPNYEDFSNLLAVSKRIRQLAKSPKIKKILNKVAIRSGFSPEGSKIISCISHSPFHLKIDISNANNRYLEKYLKSFDKVSLKLTKASHASSFFKFFKKSEKRFECLEFTKYLVFESFIKTAKKRFKNEFRTLTKKLFFNFPLKDLKRMMDFPLKFGSPSRRFSPGYLKPYNVETIQFYVKFFTGFPSIQDNIDFLDLDEFRAENIIIISEIDKKHIVNSEYMVPANTRFNKATKNVTILGPLVNCSIVQNDVKLSYRKKETIKLEYDHNNKKTILSSQVHNCDVNPQTMVSISQNMHICVATRSMNFLTTLGGLSHYGILESIETFEEMQNLTQMTHIGFSHLTIVKNFRPKKIFKNIADQGVGVVCPMFKNLESISFPECPIATAFTFISIVGHFRWENPILLKFKKISMKTATSLDSKSLKVYSIFSNPMVKIAFLENDLDFLNNLLKKTQRVSIIEKFQTIDNL